MIEDKYPSTDAKRIMGHLLNRQAEEVAADSADEEGAAEETGGRTLLCFLFSAQKAGTASFLGTDLESVEPFLQKQVSNLEAKHMPGLATAVASLTDGSRT